MTRAKRELPLKVSPYISINTKVIAKVRGIPRAVINEFFNPINRKSTIMRTTNPKPAFLVKVLITSRIKIND